LTILSEHSMAYRNQWRRQSIHSYKWYS